MTVRLIVATATFLALGGASWAQTAASDAGGQTLTPAQQANRDRIQGERENCRAQAQSQGLKGPAIHAAVLDCMSRTDPMAAKRMGCAEAARAKSLAGDELKKSVRECMASSR